MTEMKKDGKREPNVR